ncbi:MAG: hypothetical protein NUW37_04410 [Planctomycetes bacterium]|nr:hypothetical protein [Planctomycetota bacterium]
MDSFRGLVLVGLGIVVGLQVAICFQGNEKTANAGTANDAGNVTCATGKSARGDIDVLWVIDTEKRQLAAYQMSSRGVELLAARKIWYDLQLISYNDASPPEVQIRELRRLWEASGIATPQDNAPPVTTDPDAFNETDD